MPTDYALLAKRFKKFVDSTEVYIDEGGVSLDKVTFSNDGERDRVEIQTAHDWISISVRPPTVRYSVLAGGRWKKWGEKTSPILLARARDEFEFMLQGGLTIEPGLISEDLVHGEGPQFDDSGRCLVTELQRAFKGAKTKGKPAPKRKSSEKSPMKR